MKWWLKKQLLRLKLYIAENYQNEAESLVIWYAVCYAMGAAVYLVLPWEISVWVIILYLEIILLLLYLTHRHDAVFKSLTYIAVFILGLSVAKADALYRQSKMETTLPKVNYIYGHIEDIEHNNSGNIRITLRGVDNFERDLKGLFRISTRQNKYWLKQDACIETVVQMPHNYTVNPLGNYDYERALFYQGVSAAGYTISPIFKSDCKHNASYIKNKINSLRSNIAEIIDHNTSTDQGSIIKALTIGDKKSITSQQATNYRIAGLAHILAISGMHMGMIALLIFFLIRIILLPFSFGEHDWRKPSAIIALLSTLGYFMISGQSISCIRAFIMTSLILIAILFNRRAISLRLWALAILIVVTFMPYAVISPGFLMSFGAVLGLIAFYDKKKSNIHSWYKSRHLLGKISVYIIGIVIADAIASLMTLPYTLYYFHQISVYTTLGNFFAGPLVAFWIMPTLLLFLISIPLGLATYTLKPLSWGIDILNKIAELVSSLAGADSGTNLPQMSDISIVLITLGLLWLCIWQQKWRYWGFALIIIGFFIFSHAPKADFVFDEGGKTFACRADDGKLHS
ncbi:MAG: ComEC/Rec2 family competence protein, partial [Alphaproteobacteria bacterium]|nr:ComEC/Rec2 family competence protein [Alphaproteobacteria bacterium]